MTLKRGMGVIATYKSGSVEDNTEWLYPKMLYVGNTIEIIKTLMKSAISEYVTPAAFDLLIVQPLIIHSAFEKVMFLFNYALISETIKNK